MTETQNVATYARVRPHSKVTGESKKDPTARVEDNKVVHTANNGKDKEYAFTAAFNQEQKNEAVFNKAIKPLIDHHILKNGANAIFMVYGQTGSGKSHTLIGSQKELGLLPLSLEYLLDHQKVDQIDMRSIEVYGTKIIKPGFYDLVQRLNDRQKNQSGNKKKHKKQSKKPTESAWINPTKAKSVKITPKNYKQKIGELQSVSHIAPTLKNAHSSRGHSLYLCCIKIQKKRVYFVAVDLAGSEGQSALGQKDEFAKKIKSLMAKRKISLKKKEMKNIDKMYEDRFSEAKCINYGLTQLSELFEQLISKKKQKSRGTGLKKLLSEFIDEKSAYSILFTLSASKTNQGPTKTTLEFAMRAQLVKVKPKAAEATIDECKDELIEQMKKTIKEMEEQLHEKDERIKELKKQCKFQDNTGESECEHVRIHSFQYEIMKIEKQISDIEIKEKNKCSIDDSGYSNSDWGLNNVTEDELCAVFKSFDTDNNDLIDAQELQKGLETMNVRKTMQEIYQLIEDVDDNNDGYVDFDEFKKLFEESWFKNAFENKLIKEMLEMMQNMDDDEKQNIEDDEKHNDKETIEEQQEYIHELENEVEQLQERIKELETRHYSVKLKKQNSKMNAFWKELEGCFGILQEHLQFIQNQDAIVNEQIQSMITLDSIREEVVIAKQNALETETKILNDIMNIHGMQTFLESIIAMENVFNDEYNMDWRLQQETARMEFEELITKYEKKPKPISAVETFEELLLAFQFKNKYFTEWIEKIRSECKRKEIEIKEYTECNCKKIERTFYKAFYLYGENKTCDNDKVKGIQKLSDYLRCSFVFDTFDALYQCFKVIDELAPDGGILRCKDRFNIPKIDFGYRDLLINVYCPQSKSKIVCEIQLHHTIFYKHKKKSHQIYKKARLFQQGQKNLAYEYADKHTRKYITNKMDAQSDCKEKHSLGYNIPFTPISSNNDEEELVQID